jgi:hypothetical protein
MEQQRRRRKEECDCDDVVLSTSGLRAEQARRSQDQRNARQARRTNASGATDAPGGQERKREPGEVQPGREEIPPEEEKRRSVQEL